jgi:hypothetical protein
VRRVVDGSADGITGRTFPSPICGSPNRGTDTSREGNSCPRWSGNPRPFFSSRSSRSPQAYGNGIERDQPIRIGEAERIFPDIAVCRDATAQSEWVTFRVPARRRVIIPEVVVVEPTLGVRDLSREPIVECDAPRERRRLLLAKRIIQGRPRPHLRVARRIDRHTRGTDLIGLEVSKCGRLDRGRRITRCAASMHALFSARNLATYSNTGFSPRSLPAKPSGNILSKGSSPRNTLSTRRRIRNLTLKYGSFRFSTFSAKS